MTLFFFLIDAYDEGVWKLVPLCIQASDVFMAWALLHMAIESSRSHSLLYQINYWLDNARLCGIAEKQERVTR